MVNPDEPLVYSKPKRLTGLDHKVSGQVQGLLTPLAQMAHHRRRGGTFPTLGTSTERGKPVSLPCGSEYSAAMH